jgi:8-amino-7-oxononanoate synthase
VPDFTSALYLGLHHPSHALRPWNALTLGAPAALIEHAATRSIARALAELQGCEDATLAPSTLHLAWDLFGLLAQKPITLFMDAGTYPITRWGVQHARLRGAIVRPFAHYDVPSLERQLASAPGGRRPVIVADGFCPGTGRSAPLRQFCELARTHRGLLVTDDTQALGLLGHSPTAQMPYGLGGGGSLRRCEVGGAEVLVFSSLAKAFGVPMAVLAGSGAWIRSFAERSLTRVYCSPPSAAVLRAAEYALRLNRRCGDTLRLRLSMLVDTFRKELKSLGISVRGGFFPVQSLVLPHGVNAREVHRKLEQDGVRAVLQQSGGEPRLTFLLGLHLTPGQIRRASTLIATAVDRSRTLCPHRDSSFKPILNQPTLNTY